MDTQKNRSKVFACAMLAASVVAPTWAFADGISYDYLDIEVGAGNFDDGTVEYDSLGVAVQASAQIASHFFVAASYEYTRLDLDDLPGNGADDLDGRAATLGVGAFLPLSVGDGAQVDLAARLFALRADLEENTENGWGAALGPRVRFGERYEVEANATYFDIGDDGAWTFAVIGQVDVTHYVAVRAGISVDEDNDSVVYSLGARINLGE